MPWYPKVQGNVHSGWMLGRWQGSPVYWINVHAMKVQVAETFSSSLSLIQDHATWLQWTDIIWKTVSATECARFYVCMWNMLSWPRLAIIRCLTCAVLPDLCVYQLWLLRWKQHSSEMFLMSFRLKFLWNAFYEKYFLLLRLLVWLLTNF